MKPWPAEGDACWARAPRPREGVKVPWQVQRAHAVPLRGSPRCHHRTVRNLPACVPSPGRLAAGNEPGPSAAAGSQAVQVGGLPTRQGQEPQAGGKRRRSSGPQQQQQHGAAAPLPAPVALWQQQVRPLLEDRAHWWPACHFARPLSLKGRGAGGAGPQPRPASGPVRGAAAGSSGGHIGSADGPSGQPGGRGLDLHAFQNSNSNGAEAVPGGGGLRLTARDGRPVAFPAAPQLEALRLRSSVAALMLGPFNWYTQHALQELHLVQEAVANASPASSTPWPLGAVGAGAGAGRGDGGAGPRPGPGRPAPLEGRLPVDADAERGAMLQAVGEVMAAVLASVDCSARLRRRGLMGPPTPASAASTQQQLGAHGGGGRLGGPLPRSLLAGLPRSLQAIM